MSRLWPFFILITSYHAQAIRNASLVNVQSEPTLVKFQSPNSLCTGVRISYDYALTAAHCFSNESRYSKIKVQYINGNIQESKKITMENVTIYGKTATPYDLAVVRITPKKISHDQTKVVIFEEHLNPILMKKNDSFEILGFGTNGQASQGKLRKGSINYNHEFNSHSLPMLVFRPDKTNTFPCPGDSGGPLFKTDDNGIRVLVGIISFISSNKQSLIRKSERVQCRKANRAYYIPIKDHMEFIEPFLD